MLSKMLFSLDISQVIDFILMKIQIYTHLSVALFFERNVFLKDNVNENLFQVIMRALEDFKEIKKLLCPLYKLLKGKVQQNRFVPFLCLARDLRELAVKGKS